MDIDPLIGRTSLFTFALAKGEESSNRDHHGNAEEESRPRVPSALPGGIA